MKKRNDLSLGNINGIEQFSHCYLRGSYWEEKNIQVVKSPKSFLNLSISPIDSHFFSHNFLTLSVIELINLRMLRLNHLESLDWHNIFI